MIKQDEKELRRQIRIALIHMMYEKPNVFLTDLIDDVAPLSRMNSNLLIRDILRKEIAHMIQDEEIKLDKMYAVVYVKE